MGCGRVAARREVRDRRARLRHPERCENAPRHEVIPAQAGDGGDDLARHNVEHVVVGVGAAEARGGCGEPDAVRDLGPGVTRVEPQEVPGPNPRPLRGVTRSRTVNWRVTYRSYS